MSKRGRLSKPVHEDSGKVVADDSEADELPVADLDLSSDEDDDASSGDDSSDAGEDSGEEGDVSTDEDDSEEEDSDADDSEGTSDEEQDEVNDAILDYMHAAAKEKEAGAGANGTANGAPSSGGEGSDREADTAEERPVDPGSDSSEDEKPSRNTVGNVPLRWYKDEDHIGYDREGRAIAKTPRKDRLDALLARNDAGGALRTIYDEYNDEEITLTKDELAMVMRIRKGQFPHASINPYEPYVDFFSRDVEIHPIVDHPEPKRRFIPSKWEEKKIVKLVRAIRKGWLKTGDASKAPAEEAYLLWADDNQASEKTATGLSYIPAGKLKLPGHEESYNPPPEYIPTEEERAGYELMDPEDRPKLVPQAFSALRSVPQYSQYIHERFERCLDLYLCPRVRKKRMHIDPESLVPKLPKPQELQPFPTTLALQYLGHTGKVRCISVDPSGQWLLSGSDDGTLRLWEVATTRCLRHWDLGAPVKACAWSPHPQQRVIVAAVDKSVVLLPSRTGPPEMQEASTSALQMDADVESDLMTWRRRDDGGIELVHKHVVRSVTWHARGDYFCTITPGGGTQSVLVHQLSKRATQNPFRRNKGRVMGALFHPTKPFFFVATQNHVRIYNLAKQALAKKLIGGSGTINCLAVHPSGDHLLTGSDDTRVAWYDLDLSTKPYRALRYHKYPVRGVAYHRTYPLFASASDDGAVHVFHGMVYSDLLSNPLIVPVKILRGHRVTDHSGVMDCAFHPHQPWVFTAGADAAIHLYCN